MKIKSLALNGFKSFADRTEIAFHEGITAIVGPNGCGKSNISDSLRWVLGEQRPTAIRGSRMEEAIFQGTAQRRPIHRAEVTLTLANEDGILAVPQSEVAIGRTVLRGGESDYQLNGVSCRLRDIQDLCRDTGLGANAYSIIEGRMIDAILSDRTEERRALFEEAAEVGRYKDRRRTALRRLDQAEQDLARLEDVVGEVRSKVRSLGRQRGRARRYEELRERRLQLEVAVAEARLRSMEARLEEAEAELRELRRRQPEDEAGLRQRETEAESLHLRIVERERERSEVAGELEKTRSRAEQLERQRLVAGERITTAENRERALRTDLEAVQARRASLADEIRRSREEAETAAGGLAERQGHLAAVEEAVERLRQRRIEVETREQQALATLARVIREAGALEAESEALLQRRREHERELERRRSDRETAAEAVTTAERRLEKATAAAEAAAAGRVESESRVAEAGSTARALREDLRASHDCAAALESEAASIGAVAAGLASMLAEGRDLPPVVADLLAERGASEQVIGVLADGLSVPRNVRGAVEAHLGPLLHAVLVPDWKAVRAVGAWLKERKEEEGVVLLPLDPGPRRASPDSPRGLAAHVSAEGSGAAWAKALLEGVEVDDEGRLAPRSGPWVAVDGSGQDERGVVRLGRPAAGSGTLRRRGELVELEDRLATVRNELDRTRSELARKEDAAASAAAALTDLERKLAEATDAWKRAEAERDMAAGRLETSRRTHDEVDTRIGELEQLLAGDSQTTVDEARLQQLEEEHAQAESELAAERAGHLSATAEWEREQAALQELRLALARGEATQEAARERNRAGVEAERELMGRAVRLEEELAAQLAAIEEGRSTIADTEEELVDLLERRRELTDAVREARAGLEERRAELEERESALRAERQSEREASERRHALELEVAQLRGNRANIRERLEAEWEAAFEELCERVEPPDNGTVEDWATDLDDIRDRLAGIGPVNLLAAQEHEEERQRLDFLEAQKSDLRKARQDLHDSIRRINEAASDAFSRVFGEVRENFQRIFDTLFEGGQADVWLEDPDDPLDSAIEISASPRGKRTQRIHLLSGGERALTALALLFAIYLAKPSPFCVMDEVDAPLDESNIGRFTAMLEKFKSDTQFIVITHNARTIEAADWIYGVTMQEPGVSTLVGVELQDLPRGQVA